MRAAGGRERIERHGRRARWFHAAVYLLTLPLIATGAWLLAGGEGDPSPLARASGIGDAELHMWLGRAFAALMVVLVLAGWRAIAPFARETFRHDPGDARWWRRLPAAAFTGRFARHEGTFDPGQRLANVAIVGGLLVLTATGLGLTLVHGGPAFALMGTVHRWAAIVTTGAIAAHVVVAVGVLPGYRGVWRSMHLGGRLRATTARRLWPAWIERAEQGSSGSGRRIIRSGAIVAPRRRAHARRRGATMTTVADPDGQLAAVAAGPGGPPTTSEQHIELVEHYSAHNYHPLPVVVAEAEGAWVTDVEGVRYLDMLAAYSALNFGHRHPDLIAAAHAQLDRVTLTSRAFHNDLMGRFCEGLAELCGMEMVLPMNSGAEAVETAVKTARRWGYDVKGVPEDRAKIVTCEGNFHGRTITIVSFSTDPSAKGGFGPFTPGFVTVPYGDAEALETALADPDVVAFLVEPIQGEAGVVVPPEGYLRRARELCDANRVLLIADEIQSGLGRTGRTFACEHEDVRPDVYVVGKALGGGIVPLSAVVSTRDVLGVFRPGEHGSTFGGNPLACAIGLEVLRLVGTGEYQRRAAELGEALIERLRAEAPAGAVSEVRGKGLWIGIELTAEAAPARDVCERLMEMGVLAKDTHETTVRLAPPLCVTREDLDWAAERILTALAERLG